jgi:uncharacterized protein
MTLRGDAEALARAAPPVLYEVVVQADVRISMRDGARLMQDIYRPAHAGIPVSEPLPVLLERTPYGRTGIRDTEHSTANRRPWTRIELATWFASRGYVVIVQDCRGRHGSEGRFTKYRDEAEDGYDTLAWIAEQPWCNGSIGMFGLSYSAHTQTSVAALRPPALKAMILDCGGLANAYRTGVRHGGAFEMKQVTWAYRHALQSLRSEGNEAASSAMEREDLVGWLEQWPWKRGHSPLRWAPEYENYLFDQWEHGRFDEYWQQPALYAAGHYPAFEGIAVLLLSGWYDPYAQSTTDNFAGLAARASGATQMILGPWTHGHRSNHWAGEVDFGAAATLDGNIAPDYFQLRLEWFDRALKGSVASPPAAAVRYFRMGGGSGTQSTEGRLQHGGAWFEANTWPPPQACEETWFMQADGTLATEPPISTEGSRCFVHDPRDPVPTLGGAITSGLPVMTGGAFDQRTRPGLFGARPPWLPLAARGDVLVFQTAPLAEDLEVTGTLWVHLWVSADAPDVDFTVKLIDVYPPSAEYPQGFAMNLTDGVMRCRYREGWEHETMLEPGAIVPIVIEPPPISNLFRAGHRLRLDIAGSNFPRFDVNPATGEPVGKAERWQRAIQHVHCSGVHASRVVLPIIRPRR